MLKRIMLAVCVGLFVAGVTGGCGKKKETLGDKVDKGVNKIEKAGEKAGEKIKEGAEELEKKIKEE